MAFFSGTPGKETKTVTLPRIVENEKVRFGAVEVGAAGAGWGWGTLEL
jgi:hypothetical protein